MRKFAALFVIVSLIAVFLNACGSTSCDSGGSSAGSTPTVHMCGRNFVESSITISKGQSLTLVDDDSMVHIIANGSWVNGSPQSRREPGAPGTMPLSRLEHLVAEQPLETSTAWYAVDESRWPRCDAETSPDRGYYPHHSRHSNGQPIVAGWNYSWLVQIPERCSSWTAPLRVRRMQPGENINQVAAEQIRSFLRQRRAGAPCPIFTFDAGYEAVQLGVALAGAYQPVERNRCGVGVRAAPVLERPASHEMCNEISPAK